MIQADCHIGKRFSMTLAMLKTESQLRRLQKLKIEHSLETASGTIQHETKRNGERSPNGCYRCDSNIPLDPVMLYAYQLSPFSFSRSGDSLFIGF